ncbi:MAG: hypothetical protein QW291_01770 [Thermofilaceae archaeon]
MLSFGPDVERLARKLVAGYMVYFSYDLLNSEGRKIFEEMARMLIHEHPELKNIVVKARKNPTLENVMKIAERILGPEARILLRNSVNGPYSYYEL